MTDTAPSTAAAQTRSAAVRAWDALTDRLLHLPKAVNDFTITRDLPIPTRDGAVLLADHLSPKAPSRGTILVRSPYGFPAVTRGLSGGLFAGHGYDVVLARTRGTFGSGGDLDPFRTEIADGADTVSWLRQQQWFGGKFATFGGSYFGFTQWALLVDPPPEMVTAVIAVGPHDFSRAMYPGGAFRLDDLLGWSDSVGHQRELSLLRAQLRAVTSRRRQAPVNASLPLADAAERLVGNRAPWFREWVTRRDLSEQYWEPMQLGAALQRTTVPVFLQSGWQDLFLEQTLAQYSELHRRGVEVGMTIGPWTHSQLTLKGYPTLIPESLAWLAVHLAGDASAARRDEPVHLQVHGSDEWRSLPEWPPPSTTYTLYPQPGGTLRDTPAAGSTASFTYDPADPTPTVGGRLLRPGIAGYQDDSELALRDDVVAFTGPVLSEALNVVGVPVVEVAHATDNPHCDLFIRLSEVDAEGKSRNVSDGLLRLDPTSTAQSVRMDLSATAYRFAAGSRLRLLVAGGSFPCFERNLGTGEHPAAGTTMKPSRRTLQLDGCRLELPTEG